jgi:hypothetical protein
VLFPKSQIRFHACAYRRSQPGWAGTVVALLRAPRIVAFITELSPVQRILNHIGEPAYPPLIAPARGPPGWGR